MLKWGLKMLAAVGIAASLTLGSCGGGGGNGSPKVKIAYIGLTCEAPLFVAFEKGFFKEEGLEAELVKVDWTSMREVLDSGQCDATHTLVTYLLKPIEGGLDVKMTGGVHMGCLRVLVGKDSGIKTVEGLKGKRIGVPTMGSPPYLFASRVIADHGMDPEKDVVWRVFPSSEMELVLQKGEIDAVACSEPVGSLLMAHEGVVPVVDQAVDAPYKDEYCCAIVVSGKVVEHEPAKAAKVTRAILKATKWVSVNPMAAAKLSVEKKWLAVNLEVDALALSKLSYVASVSRAEKSVTETAVALRKEGILKPTTNAEQLGKLAFARLEGVTDEWISQLVVEKVAGGGPFVPVDGKLLVLVDLPSCCIDKTPH